MAHSAVKTYATIEYAVKSHDVRSTRVATQESFETIDRMIRTHISEGTSWITVTDQYGRRHVIRRDTIVSYRED